MPDSLSIDPEAESVLRPVLEPGERLLWAARRRLGWGQWPLLVLIWLLLWWLVVFLHFLLTLFGLPWTLASPLSTDLGLGVALSVCVTLWISRVVTRTCYGLTDRRVVVRTGLTGTERSIGLQGLFSFSIRERAGGRGSIHFGPFDLPLLDLEDVRRVYNLIRATAQASRSPA